MVQANGNQHSVGESVGERTERSGAADELPKPGKASVEDWVEVTHTEGDYQAGQRNDDRHEPPAAEKAEIRWQLNGVVPVEQHGGNQTDDDPAQNAVVDLRLFPGGVQHVGQYDRRHRFEHGLHHQIADHRRQRGGAVGLAGETDRHTDGEKHGQVGE